MKKVLDRAPEKPFYGREMQGNEEARTDVLHEVNENSYVRATQQISLENELQ
jgi:hypothetical protein